MANAAIFKVRGKDFVVMRNRKRVKLFFLFILIIDTLISFFIKKYLRLF
jgi:hypothetical protein